MGRTVFWGRGFRCTFGVFASIVRRRFKVDERHVGKRLKCPKRQEIVTVPITSIDEGVAASDLTLLVVEPARPPAAKAPKAKPPRAPSLTPSESGKSVATVAETRQPDFAVPTGGIATGGVQDKPQSMFRRQQ